MIAEDNKRSNWSRLWHINPQTAANIPTNKWINGQNQVNFVKYSIDVKIFIGNIVEKLIKLNMDFNGENSSSFKYSSLAIVYSSNIFDMHPAIKPAKISSTIGPNPYIIPGFASSYLLKLNVALVPAIWLEIARPNTSSL